MAHTKSSGTTKNVGDSRPKYLGVKKYAGEKAKVGDILIRQRGRTFLPGSGVRQGKDYTLYSVRVGTVAFANKRKIRYDGSRRTAKEVSVT